jgi:protein ImuB
MLWLAIRFLTFTLDAHRYHQPPIHHAIHHANAHASESKPPLAIQNHKRLIIASDTLAQAAGIRIGQTSARAKSLCGHLHVIDYQAERIDYLHQLLAAWGYQYSDKVCWLYDDSLIIEVGQSMQLFGPWPAFEATLRAQLQRFALRYALALAPSARAADLLARNDGTAITDIPSLQRSIGQSLIAHTRLSESQQAGLHSMGFRKLQALFNLARDALRRRFDAQLIRYLDQLRGMDSEVHAYFQPASVFQGSVEFDYETNNIDALIFPLKRLLNDLAIFLRCRDGGIQQFSIYLLHVVSTTRTAVEAKHQTEITIGMLSAERDATRLLEIARQKLSSVVLAQAVRGVKLIADALPSFVPGQGHLFETRSAQNLPWDALRERLRARFGDQALYQLQSHADARPEYAWRQHAILAASRDQSIQATPSDPTQTRRRPTWLLPQAIPWQGPLQLLDGPERIESGWWDGHDVRRDYYLALTSTGQLAWVYRSINAGVIASTPTPLTPWMLHGWFS